METLTARGICYDLPASPYRYKLPGTDIVLFFSSKQYKIKYIERMDTYNVQFSVAMSRKIPIKIDWGLVPYIVYYTEIEKRGFYIEIGGEGLWRQNQISAGEIRIKKDLPKL